MSKQKSYKTISSRHTQEIARRILEDFSPVKRKGAFVLALKGDLGTGKTHLAQGIAEFLGVKRIVTSPTFVIMKRYAIVQKYSAFAKYYDIQNFYHIDAYRIGHEEELEDLGWRDIVGDAHNMIVVEWAEKIKSIIPRDAVWVAFKSHSPNKRELTASLRSTI